MSNEHAQPFVGTIAAAVGGKLVGKLLDAALNKALDKATEKLVQRSDTPVQPIDKAPIKEEVRQEVVKEIGPVIENLTNSEPLWRSKVLWTAIGTLAASVGSMIDMYTNGSPDTATNYVLAGSAVVGSIGTILSRVFPSKALGR